MKTFQATFETGWRDLGFDSTQTKIIKAKDFESAFQKAKSIEWGFDVFSRIIALQEIIEE